jgi:hypothetical protein
MCVSLAFCVFVYGTVHLLLTAAFLSHNHRRFAFLLLNIARALVRSDSLRIHHQLRILLHLPEAQPLFSLQRKPNYRRPTRLTTQNAELLD